MMNLINVSALCLSMMSPAEPTTTEVPAHSEAQIVRVEEFRDCTFTVEGTFDGVKVDVEVTVDNVSWLECAALKLGVKNALE